MACQKELNLRMCLLHPKVASDNVIGTRNNFMVVKHPNGYLNDVLESCTVSGKRQNQSHSTEKYAYDEAVHSYPPTKIPRLS